MIGWIALIWLVLWRLPESPPWRLPLPLGLSMLVIAALLVGIALVWARFADRRRRPRPPATASPARESHAPRVPERIA